MNFETLIAMLRQAAADVVRSDGPVAMCRRCSHRHRRRSSCEGLRVYLRPGDPTKYPDE